MTASEVFDVGEPVGFDPGGNGTLEEPPDDADSWKLADHEPGHSVGIAAWGPAGGAQTNDRAAATNPKTGAVYAVNDEIGYWPADQGTLFITDNFFASAAGSAVAPAVTDIGQSYMITYATFGTPDAGWGVEQAAAVAGTDIAAVVVDVLDSQKAPIRVSGNTGVYVVFEIRTAITS
jgi:hypothetical protein